MRRVVLVVEDEPALLDVLAEILGRFGYDARLAGTATDAYASAQAERPSAILLDMNLPDAVRRGGRWDEEPDYPDGQRARLGGDLRAARSAETMTSTLS